MKKLKCFFVLFAVFLFAVVPGQAGQMAYRLSQCNSGLVAQKDTPFFRADNFERSGNSLAPWAEKLKSFSFAFLQGVNCQFSYFFKNRISTPSLLSQQTQVSATTLWQVKTNWLYQKVPP